MPYVCDVVGCTKSIAGSGLCPTHRRALKFKAPTGAAAKVPKSVSLGPSHYTVKRGKIKSHGPGAERNPSINAAQSGARGRRLLATVKNAASKRPAPAKAAAKAPSKKAK
jgi:hypothetical protein